MKGLIYRNIQINKKNIILAVMVMVFIFKIMVDSEISSYKEQLLLINVYTFVGMVVIYAVAEYVFKPDAVTKWQVFLHATPVTKKVIVGEKYLFDYIFLVIGAVLSTLMIIVYTIKDGGEVSYNCFWGIACAVSLILGNSAIHKILVSLMGEKCANIFSVVFVVAVLAILVVISVFSYTQLGAEFHCANTSYTSMLMCIVLLFGISVHVGSFFICVKIYNPYLE